MIWSLWQVGNWGRVLLPVILLALLGCGFLVGFEGRIDILRYLHIFGLGLMLAVIQSRWHHAPNPARIDSVIIVPAAIVYVVVFFVLRQFYDHELIYGDPVAVAICLALVGGAVLAPGSIGARLLSVPALVWLGEISFGIYMLHRPMQLVFERLPIIGSNVWLFFVVALATTLALAVVANRIVEVPARQWVRQQFMGLWKLRIVS